MLSRRTLFISMFCVSCCIGDRLVGQQDGTGIPVGAYPLGVQVSHTEWAHTPTRLIGHGTGTLQQGGNSQVITFTHHCDDPLLGNDPSKVFPARWIVQGSTLRVMLHQRSARKFSECELTIDK